MDHESFAILYKKYDYPCVGVGRCVNRNQLGMSRQFIYKFTSLLIPLVVDEEEVLVRNEINMCLDPQFK